MSLFGALVSLDASLARSGDQAAVLRTMLDLLPTFLPCSPRAIANIDEATMLPVISMCDPPAAADEIRKRLDIAIADGLFALALRRGQPVFDEGGDGRGMMLLALATPGHLAGLCIGICDPEEAQAEPLAALALAAARAGAAHENLILRDRLMAHAGVLEQRVEERTHELAAARDRAEAALRTKSVFLTTMSHELRTPLNGIIGMADLISTDYGDDERVSVIRTSADELLRQIDGILNLSKLEAGRLETSPVDADPADIVVSALRLLSPIAQRKGLAMAWRPQSEFPPCVNLDPSLLRQIIVNLVGNAIKFTVCGSVEVIGSAVVTNSAWRLSFAVRDTGPGIPPDMQARLFTAFEQGDASIQRRFGGSGLGLAISRQLAELMGGGVTVDSAVGVGSTFTACVHAGRVVGGDARAQVSAWEMGDLAHPSTPAMAGAQRNAFARARVLCADDQEVNRLVIGGQLRRLGIVPVIVSGGAEVVERALQSTWDLVLLDCQMPDIDGFIAVRMMRAGGCRTPVVAVTAHAVDGSREDCLARGFDDFLSKPVLPVALEAVLNHWLSPATASPDSVTSKPRPSRLAALREEIGEDMAQAVLAAMLNDGARLVSESSTALAQGDLATVGRRAHALKGDAANLGLDALTEIATELEHAAKAGDAVRAAAAGAQLPAAWTAAELTMRAAQREVVLKSDGAAWTPTAR